MAATELPRTQRAWRILSRGSPRDVLSLEPLLMPELRPGQALVKVKAASLNPIGYKLMGMMPNFLAKRPQTAEQDFAGIIVSVSSSTVDGTPRFKPGDRVWGIVGGLTASAEDKIGQGALSEYVTVDEDKIALVSSDSGLTMEEASGLATVGLTTVQVLEIIKPKEGSHIFVVGGSSSLGGVTIQMLKAKGYRVSTSCSAKNVESVKKLGVVYDYTQSPLHTQLASSGVQFDAIIDCIGGFDLWSHSPSYLAEGGMYLAPGSKLGSWGDIWRETKGYVHALFRPAWMGGVGGGRKFVFVMMEPTRDRFEAVNKLTRQGVKPSIDSVYEFEDALSAYDRIMTGRATGKVVVHVSSERS